MRAMFSVYRSTRQRAFTPEDVCQLRALMPYIGVAISRVQRFHEEKLHRQMIEGFNRDMPVPVILLDWSLKPAFVNREAYRAAARWNYGPDDFRSHANPDFFRLPSPVQQAARQLKDRIMTCKGDTQAIRAVAPVTVFHPDSLALSARVSASPGLTQSVARPGFFVLFDDNIETQSADPETMSRLKLVSRLTVAERELVHHLCLGLGNREIAARLNKSVLTVKTQLSAIYGKLNIRSRTRLMAIFQSL
jgi:DNA-binding CsgD family transcriptional regulator